MDISLRVKVDKDILIAIHARTYDSSPLPPLDEIYFLPGNVSATKDRVSFGAIRLRRFDGDAELSCNKRIPKTIGYEHKKYVLFKGPESEAKYLIEVLGLTEIGQIGHVSEKFESEELCEGCSVLHTVARTEHNEIAMIKFEAPSEKELISMLDDIGVKHNKLVPVDPVVYLLTCE